MLLKELFKDSKRVLPWHQSVHYTNMSEYVFPYEDSEYNVSIDDDLGMGWWHVQFTRYDEHHADSQEIVDTKGGAIIIMATIIDIVRHFIKDKNPEGIVFTAKEPSRQKLYRRLAHSISNKVDEERIQDGLEFRVQL